MINKLHEMLSRYQASAPPGSPSRTVVPQGQTMQRMNMPASPMSGAGGFGSLMSRYQMPVRKFASGGYFEEDEDGVPTLEELLAAQQSPQPAGAATDPGASMPIAVAVAPEPQAVGRSVVPTDLQSLLQIYNQPSAYDAEIRAARERSSAEQAKFDALIQRAMNEGDKGPSKSEMYFQLAQAFLNPGKTGDFTEGLGAAAGVLGRHKAAEREAQAGNAAKRAQLGLEAQKLKSQAAKDDLTTLRALSSQDAAANRAIGGKLLEQYIQSGKPQSEAGKQAMDAGFTPGTPEYSAYVQKAVQQKLDSGNWYKEAMVGIQEAGLQLRADAEKRQAAAAGRLTPKELDLKIDNEDAVSQGSAAIENLKKAKRLIESNKVLEGDLGSRAQYEYMKRLDPKNPRYVATSEFQNIVLKEALPALKGLFGPQISNTDIQTMQKLAGAGEVSNAVRTSIIDDMIKKAEDSVKRRNKRLTDINAGRYRDVSGEQ